MKTLLGAGLALILFQSTVPAADLDLTGSLWMCARAADASQFLITFYRGGGVGGGEFQNGEVNPYVFDASTIPDDQWPGRWTQTGQRFSWEFPDQHMAITGSIESTGRRRPKLAGTEVTSGMRSTVTCRMRSTLPKIGEGLVIPKDGHFMDLDGKDGVLKVPTGISLQEPGTRR